MIHSSRIFIDLCVFHEALLTLFSFIDLLNNAQPHHQQQQAIEQSKRYDGLAMHGKNISGQQDLSNFARIVPVTPNLLRIPKKIFAPPHSAATDGDDALEYNVSQLMARTSFECN